MNNDFMRKILPNHIANQQRYLCVDGDCSLYIGEGVNEEDTILRYMDFPKFEEFIKCGLRLTRADIFSKEDPFEGEYTEQIYKFSENVSSGNNGRTTTLKDNLKKECDKSRKLAFVSCWTLSDSENIALWKIYGGHDNSIAIKTSISRLKNEIEHYLKTSFDERSFCLKLMKKDFIKIKYIDHRTNDNFSEMIKIRNAEILHYKNIGYKYEEEIRIIFDSSQQGREGVGEQLEKSFSINVRPFEIIDKIVVSPFACQCFYESVKNTLQKYSMHDRIKWSDLKFVPGEALIKDAF